MTKMKSIEILQYSINLKNMFCWLDKQFILKRTLKIYSTVLSENAYRMKKNGISFYYKTAFLTL